MHLSHSGSRSDKRKARGRGLPPSSGVVLSNEARVRVRSFGFVQPCCSGTLWLSDAVCLRVHCATVPWEWLHKVLCASRVSIPRPSNLLSEHDPLCRRGSRVNFMKLTLLPRQCIYHKADRVPTKGWKVAGSKPGTHRELCGATPMVPVSYTHLTLPTILLV